MQVGRQAERCVPAVRHIQNVVLVRHPGDAPGFGDAAALRAIGLDDVDGVLFEERAKALAAREHFAACDGHTRVFAEAHVIVECIGQQRFFEPGHLMRSEHIGGAQGPFVTSGPKGIAGAGIDHQQRVRADSLARRPDDGFVALVAVLSEGSPAYLERAEALRLNGPQPVRQRLRLLHENGSIGPDLLAIAAAEQPPDRLACDLAKNVPQGNVDAADRMRDRSPAPLPKRVLVELLADAFWFEGVLAEEQRFE